MRNTFVLGLLAVFAMVGSVRGDLIISGVVDGSQTGGNPKAIELVALNPIADLSAFTIVRDTNGTAGGPFTISSSFNLPMVPLAQGDFFYIYGNAASETFLTDAGFGDSTMGTGAADIVGSTNGDDILAVSTDGTAAGIIDAFGLLGQGDTNFATDNLAYRQAGTAPNPTGVLDAGNFDLLSNSDATITSTLGTYFVPAIPEPSSLALLGLFGVAGAVRRRK